MIRRFGLAALALALAPTVLHAQYFGRNRVQYSRFDFKIVQTEHFDLYYYEKERSLALDVARLAERSYARLSRVLDHNFEERKAIILYASHAEFQETNLQGGGVEEETQGFTDLLRHRNAFPATGDYEDLAHVLQHEMTHQFQFDIWSRGKGPGGVQGIISANPPGWWSEGMAEYFSLGPVDTKTAMWLRDAAIEGKLPTAANLDRVFPYQFGQAIIAYIGQRWGDEAVGAITKGASGGGLIMALRRVLGITYEQLIAQWGDAVQKQYLPEIGNRVKARATAQPLVTKEHSGGYLHLAPALSPDGSRVVFLSDRDGLAYDLFMADGTTGKTIKQLLKSSISSNYETFRFITSSSSWSADGKHIVFAAKRNGKDDIVIVDPFSNKEVRNITLPLAGVTTPAFSPDGSRIVFSGQAGGESDLYTVNADGTDLRRLTNDKYADLHPVWSPDGKTIAFVTDRGPDTDLETLKIGRLKIALFHLDNSSIDILPGMNYGRNTSPQWAPDGKSIAFVSDRNEVANIYLYEFGDRQVYQLTDFYTGVAGITPLSPVLSWAQGADRLAFIYFEQSKFDIYSVTNPRSLKKDPWQPTGRGQNVLVQSAPVPQPRFRPVTPPPESLKVATDPQVVSSQSLYRTSNGFRRTDSLPPVSESDTSRADRQPVSIAKLMDSTTIPLPDTTEFTFRPYKVKFEPEYVARPTIGYTRDNFGRGVTGSAQIVMSDMLGDHQLVFGASLNGRLPETQLLAQYINLKRRLNWAVGVSQQPYFFYAGTGVIQGPTASEGTLVTQIQRLVFREASVIGYYPFSRFSRVEGGFHVANVQNDILTINEPFDLASGFPTRNPSLDTRGLENVSYIQPTLAYVFDNALYGYTGPFTGRRMRFEVGQNMDFIGQGWKFTSVTADLRRYDKVVGPVLLATRGMFFGRMGRDERRFRFYGGSTELIRGYTSGSFQRNECLTAQNVNPSSVTGCDAVDELVGTRAAVFNAELRFPILTPQMGIVPRGFPAIEGALFYDAGVFWEAGQKVELRRQAGQNVSLIRSPLTSYGVGIRANILNFLILRVDYARPQQRTAAIGGLWTISLGPTF